MNDMINKKGNENKKPIPEAGVYSIRSPIGNKPYIGETSRPFKKRIYDNKQALLKTALALPQSYTETHKNIILILREQNYKTCVQ